MTVVFLTLLIIVAFLILWQLVIRIVRSYAKFPAPAFISTFLDSDFRKMQQPPAKVIACSGIKPGMKVLEIGCGSGAFTIEAARAVGQQGKVYALDIQEDMLDKLRTKLARPGNSDIQNIEIINRSAYELPLEDNSLDLAFMVTVLQEIPDKQRALAQIKRVLKPAGILAVSELLPDPDYPWRSTTQRMLSKAGLIFEASYGNLWSYTVRFRKP
ncbi:MAG: class I SAM-dependent methyltransferase [Chloroflexi bacterium]|nr:class I SAM-dependent methyltransferase [Chloroflexota bacterium]